MTLPEFAEVFAVLALQLHATDADQATIDAYYRALSDVELELIQEAARRFARRVDQDGERWFPRAPEWRTEALKVQVEWFEQQRAILRRLPEPLCLRCKDTGWKRMSNGRVQPCECRVTRRQELLGRRPLPKALTGQKDDDAERTLRVPEPVPVTGQAGARQRRVDHRARADDRQRTQRRA